MNKQIYKSDLNSHSIYIIMDRPYLFYKEMKLFKCGVFNTGDKKELEFRSGETVYLFIALDGCSQFYFIDRDILLLKNFDTIDNIYDIKDPSFIKGDWINHASFKWLMENKDNLTDSFKDKIVFYYQRKMQAHIRYIAHLYPTKEALMRLDAIEAKKDDSTVSFIFHVLTMLFSDIPVETKTHITNIHDIFNAYNIDMNDILLKENFSEIKKGDIIRNIDGFYYKILKEPDEIPIVIYRNVYHSPATYMVKNINIRNEHLTESIHLLEHRLEDKDCVFKSDLTPMKAAGEVYIRVHESCIHEKFKENEILELDKNKEKNLTDDFMNLLKVSKLRVIDESEFIIERTKDVDFFLHMKSTLIGLLKLDNLPEEFKNIDNMKDFILDVEDYLENQDSKNQS